MQRLLSTLLAAALTVAAPWAPASPAAKRPSAQPKTGPTPAAASAAANASGATAPPAGRCIDEDRIDTVGANLATPAATPATTPAADQASPPAADPRATLQGLVRDSLARSQAVGASQLMAEAALSDVDEARSARLPQASLSGGFGPGGAQQAGVSQTALAQLRAGVNVSQLLYDGGRTKSLTNWRTQLAESARYGHLSQQEQVALGAVTLALERSRLRMQTQVYRQTARKMACLVEALETIVRADRGRSSELVQASKSLKQAELALSQSQSLMRQTDARLRRLVGDALPGVEGLATVFSGVPDRDALLAEVERSYEVAQLDAQVAASRELADAVAAGGKPQVSLSASTSAALSAGGSSGSTRSGNYAVGVVLNVPLYNPGLAPSTDAARKRSRAALLQRADEVESRRARVAEVHEQALAALDRVKRLSDVLRDSDQVRNFTLQQWQQLGRRSLFDVMGAESEHYSLRLAYVNALHDVQQANANLLSLGRGVSAWLN